MVYNEIDIRRAIEELNKQAEIVEKNYKDIMPEYYSALKIAIFALKKRCPRKLALIKQSSSYTTCMCLTCGHTFSEVPCFCPTCGQAIKQDDNSENNKTDGKNGGTE